MLRRYSLHKVSTTRNTRLSLSYASPCFVENEHRRNGGREEGGEKRDSLDALAERRVYVVSICYSIKVWPEPTGTVGQQR
jgi:hypothetical protein